jgi:uncharacterized protein (TIGR02453 family)
MSPRTGAKGAGGTASEYFGRRSLQFLRQLAANNDRSWFQAHRADYETHVREPFLRLVGDLQPALAKISPYYRADPRKQGGSLFRIHRDARYSHDKSPYKTWQGARFFHERRREMASPSFYLQLQPGESFVGAGIWQPEPEVQRRIRQFIFDNPAGWQAVAHAPPLRRAFTLERAGSMVRSPRGYPADWPWVEDLKLRSWTLWHPLDDAAMTGPGLLALLEADFTALAPFVDYLCAALDLEF